MAASADIPSGATSAATSLRLPAAARATVASSRFGLCGAAGRATGENQYRGAKRGGQLRFHGTEIANYRIDMDQLAMVFLPL